MLFLKYISEESESWSPLPVYGLDNNTDTTMRVKYKVYLCARSCNIIKTSSVRRARWKLKIHHMLTKPDEPYSFDCFQNRYRNLPIIRVLI